jgi:hypothetical protein
MRTPASSRALWPTVTVTPYCFCSASICRPSDSVGCDRLLGVDVLAGLGDLLRHRQVLLVGHGEDHALDRRIGEHGFHRGGGLEPGVGEFGLEGIALLLRAAVAGHDADAGGRAAARVSTLAQRPRPTMPTLTGSLILKRSFRIIVLVQTIIP